MTVEELSYILSIYIAKGYANRKVVIDELIIRNFGYSIESVDNGDNEDDNIHLSFHL